MSGPERPLSGYLRRALFGIGWALWMAVGRLLGGLLLLSIAAVVLSIVGLIVLTAVWLVEGVIS